MLRCSPQTLRCYQVSSNPPLPHAVNDFPSLFSCSWLVFPLPSDSLGVWSMRIMIGSALAAVLLSWAMALSGIGGTVTRNGGPGISDGTLRAWSRVLGMRGIMLRRSDETRAVLLMVTYSAE